MRWLHDLPLRLKSTFLEKISSLLNPQTATRKLRSKNFSKDIELAFEANNATSKTALFSDFKALWIGHNADKRARCVVRLSFELLHCGPNKMKVSPFICVITKEQVTIRLHIMI